MTSWYSTFRHFRLLPAAVSDQSPDHSAGFFIRPLRANEWRQAYELDTSVLDPDLNWPTPTGIDQYKTGPWRWFNDLISGRQAETWIAETEQGQMAGLASLQSEWGRLHTMALRVLPQWAEAQQPLLAKLLRRLQHSYRRNIRIDHPDDDENAKSLLQQANFTPQRTLSTMRLTMNTEK